MTVVIYHRGEESFSCRCGYGAPATRHHLHTPKSKLSFGHLRRGWNGAHTSLAPSGWGRAKRETQQRRGEVNSARSDGERKRVMDASVFCMQVKVRLWRQSPKFCTLSALHIHISRRFFIALGSTLIGSACGSGATLSSISRHVSMSLEVQKGSST